MLEFTTENDIDYKKKEFSYYKSVNGEAFKIGTYIVTDVNDNDSTEEVTVTAMDYGLKFANTYVTDLGYSSGTITLYDVLQECCTKCGVTLLNTSMENGDFIVDGNQFVESSQFGDVVSQIALISGNFATINQDDKLQLLFKNPTENVECDLLITEDFEYIICENEDYICTNKPDTINDYVSLDDKRDTQPITSVSLGFSNIDGEEVIRRDLDLIAEYGEHWLKIEDCPFAYSSEKQELLIDAIFNKVKGFGYSSFESKYSFKPYLQLGDIIQFKNKAGNCVRSLILKIDSDYDDITRSAPSITNATVSYVIPETAIDLAKTANIKVDEANAKIELKVNADEVVPSINLTPETIVISSSKIDVNGVLEVLGDSGSTIINGDNITTGNIQSSNYVLNTSGTKISLSDGAIVTKNFKVDATGNINSTSGLIGGWTINNLGLTNGYVKLNSDGSSTIYTVADLIIIRGYIMGTPGFSLPPAMITHYDLNGDGVVTSADYVLLQNLIGISMT